MLLRFIYTPALSNETPLLFRLPHKFSLASASPRFSYSNIFIAYFKTQIVHSAVEPPKSSFGMEYKMNIDRLVNRISP